MASLLQALLKTKQGREGLGWKAQVPGGGKVLSPSTENFSPNSSDLLSTSWTLSLCLLFLCCSSLFLVWWLTAISQNGLGSPWGVLGKIARVCIGYSWLCIPEHIFSCLLSLLCVLLLLHRLILLMTFDKIPEATSVPSLLWPSWILPSLFTTLPLEVHINLLVGKVKMIPVPNPCSIHLPPAPQESPGHQILRWCPWGAAWCQVSTWSLLLPSPACSCQLCLIQTLATAPSSIRVTSLKEQSGFDAVSASPDSCSWPSQQLGRDFQVLVVSVLLLPWLQTSPIALVWFSWIPAGSISFLQSWKESCPSKTKAVGGGFHHFCSKLHLGVLLCYSDFFTLPYLVMSGPFKSPF